MVKRIQALHRHREQIRGGQREIGAGTQRGAEGIAKGLWEQL